MTYFKHEANAQPLAKVLDDQNSVDSIVLDDDLDEPVLDKFKSRNAEVTPTPTPAIEVEKT